MVDPILSTVFMACMYGCIGFVIFLVVKMVFGANYKVTLHRNGDEIGAKGKEVKVKGESLWIQINKDRRARFPFPDAKFIRRAGRFKKSIHVQSPIPGVYQPMLVNEVEIKVLDNDARDFMYQMEENARQIEKKGMDLNKVVTAAVGAMIVFAVVMGLYVTWDVGLPQIKDLLVAQIDAEAAGVSRTMETWRDSILAMQSNLTRMEVLCQCG